MKRNSKELLSVRSRWSIAAMAGFVIIFSCILLLQRKGALNQSSTVSYKHRAGERVAESVALLEAADPGEPRVVQDAALPQTSSDIGLPGRVIDSLFQTPVVARVEPNEGIAVYSTTESGRFILPNNASTYERIVVSSPGYLDKSITIDPAALASELDIRLQPSQRSRIVVRNQNGTPADGVSVDWKVALDTPETIALERWIDASAQRQGEVLHRTTDAAGVSEMSMACRSVATVTDSTKTVIKAVQVNPGQERQVILPESPLLLQFIDQATKEPKPALAIEAWFPTEIDAMTVPAVTDEQGIVVVSPSSYPVLIRKQGNSARQSELVPLTPEIERTGFTQSVLRIGRSPVTSTPLQIAVTNCGQIRIMDGDTGSPVSGNVRIQIRRRVVTEDSHNHTPSLATILSARSSFYSPDSLFSLVAGILDLPCRLDRPQELLDGIHPLNELVIIAAGYSPLIVGTSSRSGTAADGVPAFLLAPSKARTLRIVHADGIPFNQAVWVYSPKADFYCWAHRGIGTGIHGPFDWPGGDIDVFVSDKPEAHYIISAELLDTEAELVLELSSRTGGIRVVGIPSNATRVLLMARNGVGIDGREYFINSMNEHEGEFRGLCPGTYLVGPRSWVLASEYHSVQANLGPKEPDKQCLVSVRSGETTTVNWLDGWMGGREVTGQVRVQGNRRIEPFLVPDYGLVIEGQKGNARPQMLFGRRSPILATDLNGIYKIDATDPLPSIIAVCLADETIWGDVSGLRIIETMLPGESTEIETTDIIVRWKGTPPDRRISVSYELPASSMRYPIDSFHADWRREWHAKEPLTIVNIPLYVSELKVGAQVIPISLRRGESLKLEVDSVQ